MLNAFVFSRLARSHHLQKMERFTAMVTPSPIPLLLQSLLCYRLDRKHRAVAIGPD
jgi:hypothetical protein